MLKPEDRQFDSGLRAPAFIMTRKTGLIVLGFYSTKKKSAATPSYSSMDFDKTGQDLSNPSEVEQVNGRSWEEGNCLFID